MSELGKKLLILGVSRIDHERDLPSGQFESDVTVLEKPFGEAELQVTPHRAQHHKTATPSTGNIIP